MAHPARKKAKGPKAQIFCWAATARLKSGPGVSTFLVRNTMFSTVTTFGFVSGHDFSRAALNPKQIWALAPAPASWPNTCNCTGTAGEHRPILPSPGCLLKSPDYSRSIMARLKSCPVTEQEYTTKEAFFLKHLTLRLKNVETPRVRLSIERAACN